MLSPLESESLEVLHKIQDAWGAKYITHARYLGLMGDVRDVVKKLENRQYGCATGLHAGPCACKEVLK